MDKLGRRACFHAVNFYDSKKGGMGGGVAILPCVPPLSSPGGGGGIPNSDRQLKQVWMRIDLGPPHQSTSSRMCGLWLCTGKWIPHLEEKVGKGDRDRLE